MCVDNCLQFKGIEIAYYLEMGDRNASASVQSCYTAVGVARSLEDMSGVLYINDTEPFSRPECQEVQYVLVAQEQQKKYQEKKELYIIFDGDGKYSVRS